MKIIARNSRLSLLQVEEVMRQLPDVEYELTSTLSFGDKHKDTSLMDNIPDDFFTRELDDSLLNNSADVAIHSAKDLPYPLPEGLEIYALTKAADKSDSLVSRNNLTLSQLPAGSRIATSSAKRKQELLAMRPDLTVASVRGTIEERIRQVDEGKYDALIVATCAMQRLGLDSRIAERLPFETHPLQGHLAVVGRKGEESISRIFAPLDIRPRFGNVTLVGFGPGNADLLTIGGERALDNADIIMHDDLIDSDFLNRYEAEKLYVGKRSGKHSHNQDEINRLMMEAAYKGKNVVRLKGGDPMTLAHGREEIDFLESCMIDTKVIPGITAALAMAAQMKIPLTHRGIARSMAIISGHTVPLPKENTGGADTLVYYMGGSNIPSIAQTLIDRGRNMDTPVMLAYNVSRPDHREFFFSLGELTYTKIKFPTPILMVVGETVAFARHGKPKVLATGTSTMAAKDRGEVTHTQLIQTKPIDNDHTLGSVSLRHFNWIVFTSRNGVRYFFEAIDRIGIDIRSMANTHIASVGKATSAELRLHHLSADFESPTESAEGIVAFFDKEKNKTGNALSILLPRSAIGIESLPKSLKEMGHDVTEIALYTTEANSGAKPIDDLSQFNEIIFTSPSCVSAFKKIYGSLPEGIPLTAKGKTTLKELRS